MAEDKDNDGEWSHDLKQYISDTIPPRLAKKWARALRRVNKIMDEILEECPSAEVFLSASHPGEATANLLYGPSQDGALLYSHQKKQQHRIVEYVTLRKWDGGDW